VQGDLRKIKPSDFDSENKKGEDVEAWLLGIRKYFQLYSYSSNLEDMISIYHRHRKNFMWWDQLNKFKHISEKRIYWKYFKKYFQQQYNFKHYYDKNMQDFFEIKLGSMIVDEYENKFL
jgi:hypothetical protein